MGGEIYIARRSPGSGDLWSWDQITRQEWETLLSSTDGVRQACVERVAVNPVTRAELRIPPDPDTAELYDPDSKDWIPLLSWQDGAIMFYPPKDASFMRSALMKQVFMIARALGAAVIDGRSGSVIHESPGV